MEVKKKIKEMLESGHTDIAKLLIREFEALHPRDSDIHLWKAEIQLSEDKLDEAQRTLIEAIGCDHRRRELYDRLAEVYRRQNKPELAHSLYKRAEPLAEIGIEPPLVSIIVLAFNHLEYTKRCIESIYQHTSHIPFELITVDNGSSDGTAAYFNQLPNRKKVALKANAGPVNGFNAGMIVADGTYTACISNDFIVTARWMDNLLACISSDEAIGFVSPGADSVSNNQQIECPAADLEAMHRFAEGYNVSDPLKWEERVRLLPCVLMARTGLLKQVGFFDPRFYYGEFADDDISFRIRRAGYKLIFAKDTFTHHAGSVTVGEDQRKHRSLEVSSQIFRDKYGLDAWADAQFDLHLVETALDRIKRLKGRQTGQIKIMGINTKCGSTPLQLRNRLKESGYGRASITSYTDQEKYLQDLRTVSDKAVYGPLDGLDAMPDTDLYNLIVLEGGLEAYDAVDKIIGGIRSKLAPGGSFLFKMKNGAYYLELVRWLSERAPIVQMPLKGSFFHLQPLLALLEKIKLPASQLIAVQDQVHPHLSGFYNRLEELAASYEAFKSAGLSVPELVVVAEMQA
jgi:GT2 family glycosyltransferase